MLIDLDTLSPDQIYFRMTQSLIPRPIAWVLSDSGDGRLNLAPFSYFNAVCSDPPLIMLSVGRKPDGTPKDTRRNIAERNLFVVQIPRIDQIDAVNESSATLDHGISEIERLGLALSPIDGFPLPRLADCPIAYACERFRIDELGPGGQALILGRVRRIHVADEVVAEDSKGRLRIDPVRVAPLCRLGADAYAGLGEILRRRRPG